MTQSAERAALQEVLETFNKHHSKEEMAVMAVILASYNNDVQKIKLFAASLSALTFTTRNNETLEFVQIRESIPMMQAAMQAIMAESDGNLQLTLAVATQGMEEKRRVELIKNTVAALKRMDAIYDADRTEQQNAG